MRQVSKIQSPQDIIAILWRRKWQVIIPAFLLLAASVVVALVWPKTYQSKATILIEEPDVVMGVEGTPIADNRADQRVQVITQQILSSENLIKLINKFDLYPEARASGRYAIVVSSLRDRISVDFISAEVNDPRMVRPGQATIAFTISFVDEDPKTAQMVVEELVSLYLAENLRTRNVRASETSDFLAKEAEKLGQQITELEADLAAFKLENAGSLPDQVSLNQQAINRIELQLIDLRQRIQSQEERKVYLESQLAQVSPFASITLNDGTVLRPEERLRKLQSEYSQLSNTYGPRHPRMVELSKEMSALREKMGIGEEGLPDEPSNPAYIQLQTELTAVNSSISSLRKEQADMQKRLGSLEGQNLKAPDIEREFRLLTRNYENATAEYRAVKEKQWEAERLESIETELKGERFSVIEPPDLPIKPVAPQRRLMVMVGFMIAVVGGLGTAAIAEILDQTVSGPRHLAAIAGKSPLVIIPFIESSVPRPRAFSTAVFVVVALAAAAAAAGLIAVNEFVVPLDHLWAGFVAGPDAG